MENNMTNNNATLANEPSRATLTDCQYDAVLLRGLIYAIDHMLTDTSDSTLHESATAMVIVARDMSDKLTNDLDGVKEAKA
jgi:hypothetical protein